MSTQEINDYLILASVTKVVNAWLWSHCYPYNEVIPSMKFNHSFEQTSIITFARLLSNKGFLLSARCTGSGSMMSKAEIVDNFLSNLKILHICLKS